MRLGGQVYIIKDVYEDVFWLWVQVDIILQWSLAFAHTKGVSFTINHLYE